MVKGYAIALTEAENLLQTVINYWEALKSTSPDGLREGFLQRAGKLTQGDGNTYRWKENYPFENLLYK